MLDKPIDLASISWIDKAGLPKVGFWFVAGAKLSWSKRVIMGLVGTANPQPPETLTSIPAFMAGKQYRALLSCRFSDSRQKSISAQQKDAGYTPPFDKNTIPALQRRVLLYLEEDLRDPNPYPGDLSPVSSIVLGQLHPCSSLSIPRGSAVLLSALIKFRAGKHTDAVGIDPDKAGSPVHVPWVWCEYALTSSGSERFLVCNGSVFPSHAWYVNGKQVGKHLQIQVHASDTDPVLTTGQPAGKLRDEAETDKSTGKISGHLNAVDPGQQEAFDVSSLLK